MKPGLHLALRAARQIGAEEGSLDAARVARRPLARRTAFHPITPDDRARRFAAAVADMFADRDTTPETGPIPHDLTDED